jgi:hypothetical protein
MAGQRVTDLAVLKVDLMAVERAGLKVEKLVDCLVEKMVEL